MIFGYPLPNNLSSLVSGKPGPWTALYPTTLFDLSTVGGIDHEVVVAIYEEYIYSGTTITYEWYRDRDNYKVFNWTGYASTDWNSIAAWIGWVSQETQVVLGLNGEGEIVENGIYHVNITGTGASTFSNTINFAVIGIPAWVWLHNPTISGFDWKVSLSDYFDTSNYIQAGICNQPFTDGQSTLPNGVVDAVYPSGSTISTVATGTVTGQSSNTVYTLYGFAQASNGLYYQSGSASIKTLPQPTVPSSPVSIVSRIEGGFNLTWGISDDVEYYKLYYKYSYQYEYQYIPVNVLSNTYTLIDRDYGVQHDFKVRAVNGSYQSDTTSVTLGTTAPKSPGNITCPLVSANDIDIRVADGMSGNWDYIRIYKYDNLDNLLGYLDLTKTNYDNEQKIVTFSGLSINTQYKFNAATYYTANSTLLQSVNWSNDLYVTTPALSRPSNFSWTTSKIQGDPAINLTAIEWNGLCTRINEFRLYKGLSSYSFTILSSGGFFYAYMLNEARNSIFPMNSVGLPSTKLGISDVVNPNDADNLLASDLNALVSCLNAIV